ncbi:T9SS type B sorting domain-containing protein [Leeuwenhoekiella sp. W20_SRS_FM14]|uniref:T9SS type B sorting domain-containing protein n=1 Tax=Leeuwenhoekiella sp. W20_SRS_FM14 TaxID=3240270 RepID=UPI003F97BEE3
MKKNTLKQNVLYILFLLSVVQLNAQSQANNWYFGKGAGLNFNNSTPQVLIDGQLDTLEGCATISDDNGSLLFYTDGQTVYTANHTVMNNGTGLFGNASSTQSAIIIPQPNTPGIYYIFTIDTRLRETDVDKGLNYSIVNFNSNPQGEVTVKNRKLLNFASEKLSAVIKSCVTNSVWMVAFSSSSGNEEVISTLYAYELNDSGIQLTPVKSNLSLAIEDRRGNMKFSPDGKQLAIANMFFGLYLTDFNPATGMASNLQQLSIDGPNKASYGVEFSPNNKYLYVHSSNGSDEPEVGNHFSSLIQYDIEAADISASQVLLDQEGYYRGSLQLAPDGKIYRTLSLAYSVGLPYLGVIDNPNAAGVAANYRDRAINLGSGISFQGLPPFNQSLFNELDIIQNSIDSKKLALCDGDTYTLKYEAVPGATYSWYLNDNLIPGETTFELTIRQPAGVTLTYTENYEFRLDPNDGSCEKIGYAEVTYYAFPQASAGARLVQCEDSVTADGLSIFNLNEANSDFTLADPNLSVTYHPSLTQALLDFDPIEPVGYENKRPSETLYARIVNPAGCAVAAPLNLVVSSTAVSTGLLEECDVDDTGFVMFNLRNADSQVSGASTGTPDINYYLTERGALLEDANELLPVAYTNSTAYNQIVFARVENNNACFAISQLELRVNPKPDFTLPEEAFYCASVFPELETYVPDYSNLDTSRTYTYLWLPEGQTKPELQTNLPGEHTLRVTDVLTNCFREETFTIEEKELAIIENIEVTDASDNNTAVIAISGNGEYEFTLDDAIGPYQDSSTFTGLLPGFHTVYVRSKEGCGIVEQEFSIIGFMKYFTPNGDGYHDTWQVQGISELVQPGTVIRVFNRYGKLLKEINPLGEGWDGTVRGVNSPADDYWFDVLLEDGRVFKSHFTLKR